MTHQQRLKGFEPRWKPMEVEEEKAKSSPSDLWFEVSYGIVTWVESIQNRSAFWFQNPSDECFLELKLSSLESEICF